MFALGWMTFPLLIQKSSLHERMAFIFQTEEIVLLTINKLVLNSAYILYLYVPLMAVS